MLPVQTVMIRYMVLVYRWGSGWLGEVGDWGGAWGGAVTGGGARWGGGYSRRRTYCGRAKAPPIRDRRGLLEVSATWLIFLASSQIHLEALRAHSCNQISVFSYPTN